MASLIPIPIVDQKDRRIETVRASYANFLWGLPPEKDALYPELGLSTADSPADGKRRVLSVEKDSVAKLAGFEEGDLLISMDGTPLNDREAFNRLMAEKNWGDSAAITIRRGEREMPIQVLFRRKEPAKPAPQPTK